jgi:hypothetical protein
MQGIITEKCANECNEAMSKRIKSCIKRIGIDGPDVTG